jgi:hypothetical protein
MFDPSRYDAKLMLLCLHILTAYRRRAHGIADFAREVAAALQQLGPLPPRYTGEALLLSQLGYGDRPPAPVLGRADAGGDAFQLLAADEDQVRAVCNNVAAATHFGRLPLQADEDVRGHLGRVLRVLLLAFLREYHLETGAILLRAIHYLRLPRTRAFRLAVRFLVDQQHGDGKFGYFALETSEICKTVGRGDFDPAPALHLPTTLTCLWSLAESLIPGFNLFSLSGGDGPGVGAPGAGPPLEVHRTDYRGETDRRGTASQA